MGIFDLLLDELAKEIKEAPGWVSLVVVCNLILLLPSVHRSAESLPIDIGMEQGTVATLVAIVLFFLGDALDTFVFPREKDGRRLEKVLQSFMLALAAWGFFFLFIRRNWVWDARVWVLWAFLFLLHGTLTRSREKRKKRAARNVETTEQQKKAEQSGLAWLVPADLTEWRKKAEEGLSVHDGVYAVSKSLAKAAHNYNLSWIQLQNESAKFIRSTVLPTATVGGLLLFRGQRFWAAFAFLVAFALLVLYSRLKAWHMRGLYRLAVERIVTSTRSYSATDLANGVRVFCWNGAVAAFGKRITTFTTA